MNASDIAQINLQALRVNPYPGRGIVIGFDPDGKAMMITWIMGRGENSRNRVYSHDGTGRVYTEAADPAKMKDPSNIIYNAMNVYQSVFVASNGSQTDTVIEANAGAYNLHAVLLDNEVIYEPDKPNSTPRITATIDMMDDPPVIEFEILKKSRWGDSCDRHSFTYEQIENGLGLCVTTYASDGNPLPSFEGEPYLLPIPAGGREAVANCLWDALDKDNRVALAVMEIDLESADENPEPLVTIINRFTKVNPS